MYYTTCRSCYHRQEYKAQFACVSCKKRLNHWAVIADLQLQSKTLADYRAEYDHEEADAMEEKK
jgi:hypothetical protein